MTNPHMPCLVALCACVVCAPCFWVSQVLWASLLSCLVVACPPRLCAPCRSAVRQSELQVVPSRGTTSQKGGTLDARRQAVLNRSIRSK